MKISEIENVLNGDASLTDFCLIYEDAKTRFYSRKDGVIVSCDLGMVFDSEGFVVTESHVRKLREFPNNDCMYFFANLMALSDFDYDNEETKDIVYALSE